MGEAVSPGIQVALCPFCKEEIRAGAIKCKHCNSTLTSLATPHTTSDVLVVEALKTTNTCLLWVSLDYWNLYAFDGRIILARCYRGRWGLIGAFIGLFFYVVASTVIGALGVLLDRQNGTAKCKLMKDSLRYVLQNAGRYHVLEARRSSITPIESSDLCLGNLWLKYMIRVNGKSFYFEESKYDEVRHIIRMSAASA